MRVKSRYYIQNEIIYIREGTHDIKETQQFIKQTGRVEDILGKSLACVSNHAVLNHTGSNHNAPVYTPVHTINLQCTPYLLKILDFLNEEPCPCPYIDELCLERLNDNFLNYELVINFMKVNTTIRNLNMDAFSGHTRDAFGVDTWDTFMNCLCLNTILTSLTIGTFMRSPELVIKYVSANTTLKYLNIYVHDPLMNLGLFESLQINTVLTGLVLFLHPRATHNLLHEKLPRLIATTTTLKSLVLPYSVNQMCNVTQLAKSVVQNTSLNHMQVMFNYFSEFKQFTQDINENYTITRLELEGGELKNATVAKFLARNRSFLWRNIHPVLVNFSLIFYQYPAYVVLEIFDWLPHMHLANHVKKIHLIIAVKKSVQRVKN